VLSTLCLRRVKDQKKAGSDQAIVQLPPKNIETLEVELSPAERKVYDRLELAGKKVFNHLLKKGMLVRTRLLARHPQPSPCSVSVRQIVIRS
jgi:DNA repair protein RAD5